MFVFRSVSPQRSSKARTAKIERLLSYPKKIHFLRKSQIATKAMILMLWYNICGRRKTPEKSVFDKGDNIDALIQEVRQNGYASIQQRCGTMRVLDISYPIGLNDIYINVNILEKISGCRRLEDTDLLKVSASDDFERLMVDRIAQKRVNGEDAVNKYSKLFVLGKPGTGKTTFLKHIALKCSSGKLQADRVPIFITLKDFAETKEPQSLLEYITEQISTEGITDTVVEHLLSQGKMLILLDGLDEVKEIDSWRVLQSVRSFFTQFHLNHFVITCRIAVREYIFEQFTDVEIADFDDEQIDSFASKWFAVFDSTKSNKFIQKLKAKSPIRELATNPLLLNLLCVVFEESADFPANRSELYKEGLNVLLKKWDAKPNIEREQIYKKLCIQHKGDLLSQIALMTFKRGDYFFRRKEIEQHIADYIRNFPNVSTEIEALQLDSEAVLKSIETQHGLLVERARGIYSFSHLTFHEYFTAREIVASSAPQALETALKQLVNCITEKRWREVFLLSVGMLRNADYLLQLMKQQIDLLLAQDKHLQAFLSWLSQKCYAVTTPYKRVTVRAFYLDLTLSRELIFVSGALNLTLALDPTLVLTRDFAWDFALDRVLDRALALAQDKAFETKLVLKDVLEHAREHAYPLTPDLDQALQDLKEQLPDSNKDREKFQTWWRANGETWTEKLRAVMIEHCHIGHDWQFSNTQQDKLRQYYYTNKLLVDCLNSNCYMTRAVQDEISSTLLLPIAQTEY